MKYSFAVALLINNSQAVQQKSAGGPDVYGNNGSGYSNTDAAYDLSRIGIDIADAGKGDNCKPGDWTTVHWVASLKDGRVVSDSRAEPGGLPKTFALGAHEVFSCWDFAIPKLKQGAKARLDCPSFYAWGNAYSQAPLGGEPIPLHSDVNFDIEVVECNRTPDFTDLFQQPHTTTMQPEKCMWLHLEESDATGNDMVLTEQDNDVIIHHKQTGDESQQWYWNEKTGKITNGESKKELGDNSGDAYLSKSSGDKWWFNQEDHTITKRIAAYSEDHNDWVMNKYLSVPKEKMMPGSEVDVMMARAATFTNHHWRIEYCDVHLRK